MKTIDGHSAGPIFCDEDRERARPRQSVGDEQDVIAYLAKNGGSKSRCKVGELGTGHGATLYGGHGLKGVNIVRSRLDNSAQEKSLSARRALGKAVGHVKAYGAVSCGEEFRTVVYYYRGVVTVSTPIISSIFFVKESSNSYFSSSASVDASSSYWLR
jgi:hypothetical protein